MGIGGTGDTLLWLLQLLCFCGLLLIFYLFNLRVCFFFTHCPMLRPLLLLSFAKYAVFMRTANGKDGQKINCSNFLVGTWQQ